MATRIAALVLAAAVTTSAAEPLPYASMAARIASALRLSRGERVLLRLDPRVMPELEPAVARALLGAGARVETLPYGTAPDLAERLARTYVYVWLPAPAT